MQREKMRANKRRAAAEAEIFIGGKTISMQLIKYIFVASAAFLKRIFASCSHLALSHVKHKMPI